MVRGKIYSAADLAIVVPTKDRPEKMCNLLKSLAAQSMKCGRIIVVASGESIRKVIENFADFLPIEYYESELSGQIKQRNLGIRCLDSRTSLVATLDDDIILEAEAIEKMICFWNQCAPETVGIGFNIINEASHKHSWLRGLMGISTNEPGKILRSGWSTSICNIQYSIRSQWLNGGATVWKQEVLKNHPHKEIKSRWAVCEDLIFSYPIGKSYPLYICAEAKVIHDHVFDQKVPENIFRFRARSMMLWLLFFVDSNPELSKKSYYRAWFFLSLGYGIQALFAGKQRRQRFNSCFGCIEGGLIGLNALIKRENMRLILENQN